MRVVAILVAVLVLGGCVAHQARLEGSIRPLGDDQYEVKLPFFVDSPADSQTDEKTRLGVLAEFMTENGYCAKSGWTVTDRQVTTRIHSWLGTAGDIYYHVACNA